MGSTISPDGSYLYFSAEVRDPSIDPSVYYAYRVCRYEISTGIFQTYNKTLVERMPPAGGYTMDVMKVQGFSFAESRVLYYDEVQQLNIQPLPDGTLITNMYQSLVAVDTK